MTDFDIFDPRSWFDDSGVLVRRSPAATKRKPQNASLESLKKMLAGVMVGAISLGAAQTTPAHSGSAVVYSRVPTPPRASDVLPKDYWPGALTLLKRAPIAIEDPDPEDAADPVL